MKLAVVGGRSFVAGAVCQYAREQGCEVRVLVRRRGSQPWPAIEVVETGDLLSSAVPPSAFEGCDAVVNCVARVHIMRETERDPEAAYKAVNSDLAVKLLDAAADAAVKRFVQLSSVAAVAPRTPPGITVTDDFEPAPRSPYGRSKLEADRRLQERGAARGISVVSLRPPSVIGPGVRAYFEMLLRCAKLGLPLPIGAVRNRRSFIFVENLASAVLKGAAGTPEGAFIVTDSPPISTSELYRSLLRMCRRPAIVPRIQERLIRRVGKLILGDRVESLLGDAAYDGTRFATEFDWTPTVDFQTALRRTVIST